MALVIDKLIDESSPSACTRLAVEAEADGFDGVLIGERCYDPFVRLAAIAERTTSVQLASAVVIAPPRSPTHVAYAAHDLAAMSDGRFILGLGHQIPTHLTRRFGVPGDRPVRKMRDYVDCLRAIWAAWEDGTRLDFHSPSYTLTLMPEMFRPGFGAGPLPIWMAAVGPDMTTLAGEVSDGVFLHPFTTRRYVETVTRAWLKAGEDRRTESAPTELSLPVMVGLGDTGEQVEAADRAVRKQIAFYASTPAYRTVLQTHNRADVQPLLQRLSREGKWDEMTSHIDDDLAAVFSCVGRPEEVAKLVAERWAGLVHRIGINTPNQTPDRDQLRELIQRLHATEQR